MWVVPYCTLGARSARPRESGLRPGTCKFSDSEAGGVAGDERLSWADEEGRGLSRRVSISMRCGLCPSGRACLSGACRPFGRYLLILILILAAGVHASQNPPPPWYFENLPYRTAVLCSVQLYCVHSQAVFRLSVVPYDFSEQLSGCHKLLS